MTSIQKIIEEFEKRFVPLMPGFSELKDWTKNIEGTTASYMALKYFLLSALNQIRQETLEDIESGISTWGGDRRYNQAILDVIEFIQSRKNL